MYLACVHQAPNLQKIIKGANINVSNIPWKLFFHVAMFFFCKANIKHWILIKPFLSSMYGLYIHHLLT